jgi:hypothetical protein
MISAGPKKLLSAAHLADGLVEELVNLEQPEKLLAACVRLLGGVLEDPRVQPEVLDRRHLEEEVCVELRADRDARRVLRDADVGASCRDFERIIPLFL